MEELPPRRRLVTASAMARRLRVTLRWLRAEAEAGRLPCIRAEKQLLFDADVVERVLLERAGKSVVEEAGDG